MRHLVRLVSVPVVSFVAACAAEPGRSVDGGTSGAEETATTDATEAATTEAEPAAPVPAHGVAVDIVEVNQGVGVKIGEGGEWVGPTQRTAPLLQNRLANVRVLWKVTDPQWQPREIEGHLYLSFPDGTQEVLKEKKLIERDSFIGSLDETFNFYIPPELVVPGLEFRVELWEVEGAEPNPDVTTPPSLPADGKDALVGIESTNLSLDIVIVPFHYNDGAGCNTTPDTSEETMKLFSDYMYMMNPVDRVNITMHEPIAWNEPLSNFGELNSFMSALRFEEGAPSETYYYGLVDVCTGGLNGAGGQAYGIPDDPTDPGMAYRRVSSGLSLEPEWSAETFVHEVGHSQGRRHVACEGEGGPDPSYPIQGGDVGEWGFGVIDFKLRHPTVNKDYMTYCHPAWVSTWGWNKVYPIIKELSSWSMQDREASTPKGSVLVGTISESGQEIWHTVPGSIGTPSDGVEVEFVTRGGSAGIRRAAAEVQTLPDSGGTMIVVPLPENFDDVTSITRIETRDGATRRAAVDVAKIRRGLAAR